jgi:hypothetical protein
LSDIFISPSELETLIPVPLRLDRIVRIVGLPSDLTIHEAARIANILYALAGAGMASLQAQSIQAQTSDGSPKQKPPGLF